MDDKILCLLRDTELTTYEGATTTIDLVRYERLVGLAPNFSLLLSENGLYGTPGTEYSFLPYSPVYGLYMLREFDTDKFPIALLGLRWDEHALLITQIQGQNLRSSLMIEAGVTFDEEGI